MNVVLTRGGEARSGKNGTQKSRLAPAPWPFIGAPGCGPVYGHNLRAVSRLLCLGQRLDAACAKLLANAAAIFVDADPLNIRLKLPLRLLLRETYFVARHRPLATIFTFRHNFTLPGGRKLATQTKGDLCGRLVTLQFEGTTSYYRLRPFRMQPAIRVEEQ